jgi:hypothetical protein
MTTDLAESCAALAKLLPVARALTARPDTDGTTGGGQPSSRPPWNQAAENAVLDAHEGVRRLEASWRLIVTGHTGPRRGGSDANTMAAIKAAVALAYGLPVRHIHEYDDDGNRKPGPCRCHHCRSVRFLERLMRPIEEHPAVDKAEPWRRVAGIACPYCGYPMLRVRPREMTVTCLRYGICRDSGGQHPVGHMEISRLTCDPIVRWNDGLVAP